MPPLRFIHTSDLQLGMPFHWVEGDQAAKMREARLESLTRIGDVATGTLEVPRAGWFFYKITRGAWPTVEKDPTCAERTNRHGFGTPGAITVNVAAWADKCP